MKTLQRLYVNIQGSEHENSNSFSHFLHVKKILQMPCNVVYIRQTS